MQNVNIFLINKLGSKDQLYFPPTVNSYDKYFIYQIGNQQNLLQTPTYENMISYYSTLLKVFSDGPDNPGATSVFYIFKNSLLEDWEHMMGSMAQMFMQVGHIFQIQFLQPYLISYFHIKVVILIKVLEL